MPLRVGAAPPQMPKPPALSTGTALQVASGSSTTSPLIRVMGAVGVLVIPAVAAIANDVAVPMFTPVTAAAQLPVAGPAVNLQVTDFASSWSGGVARSLTP